MKKLLIITGILLGTVMILFSACGAAEFSEDEAMQGDSVREEEGYEKSGFVTSVAESAPASLLGIDYASDDDNGFTGERMIVRTGQMALIVEDVPAAIEDITAMAQGYEGYVVSSRVWKIRERLVGSISIRVPSEHFGDATGMLRKIAVDVSSESSNSRDVTEEYTDLTAKLVNLEAAEQQLQVILGKAETVEDILNVQRELTRTRGEIEQTQGRIQYLERTSATSLIEINLEQSKLGIEFSAQKTTVKEREAIWFSAEINGGFQPYSYQWDMGDGDASTEGVFQYSYSDDGEYTVKLTVTDDRGNTLTETRTDYITVLSGWEAGNAASSAWNGLVVFSRVLADIFIWLGVFSPLWITVGGIVYFIIRRHRRNKKSQ